MTDELKKALADFALKALSFVEKTANEQLPLILQDIVGAAQLEAWILIALFGFLLVFGVALFVSDCIVWEEGPAAVFGVILTVVGGIGTAVNVYALLYAMWYPRLVIVDYLRALL